MTNGAFTNVETEAQVVRSLPVAGLVAEDVGGSESPDSLLASVEVTTTIDTEVMVIQYASPSSALAQEVANSFAENYLTYKREQAEESIEASTQSIERSMSLVQQQLSRLLVDMRQARQAGDTTLLDALETERGVAIARLGVLQQQLDDSSAVATQTRDIGQVLELATLPTRPASPDHIRNGVAAAILGLGLGIGMAFLRNRLDDRFRSRDDVQHVMKAPVLAAVPRFERSKAKGAVVMTHPNDPASESYRTLRTGLQFLASQLDVKTILLTSPAAGEGKTVTTVNLALILAQAGNRVIVVSADLRRPTLDAYFRAEGRPGLTDWLLGSETDLTQLLLDPGVRNIRVLPSGKIPANPAELLAAPATTQLWNQLRDLSDFVLVDSPPVLPVADALILASRLDGTIVVLNATGTHRSAGVHAQESLQRVDARILGSVLNNFDASGGNYGSAYGAYYGRYQRDLTEDADQSNGRSSRRRRKKEGKGGRLAS
jgi:capsular exopolysaccharide synthesis family protein